MKVIVDQEICIGCGACENTCPEVFRLNVDGVSEVFEQPKETSNSLIEAVDGCPVEAISIAE